MRATASRRLQLALQPHQQHAVQQTGGHIDAALHSSLLDVVESGREPGSAESAIGRLALSNRRSDAQYGTSVKPSAQLALCTTTHAIIYRRVASSRFCVNAADTVRVRTLTATDVRDFVPDPGAVSPGRRTR